MQVFFSVYEAFLGISMGISLGELVCVVVPKLVAAFIVRATILDLRILLGLPHMH